MLHKNSHLSPRHRSRGATLIEVIVVLAIMGIVALIVGSGMFLNTPGQTEDRASLNARAWAAKAGVTAQRLTCAHDSDSDGFGSCTVVTEQGEKVYLQCPAGWWANATGATSCKEVESAIQLQTTRRGR